MAAADLPVVSTFQTGSGGGGGSADYADRPYSGGTSGGGGGGGALKLETTSTITITGQLRANGGTGADVFLGAPPPRRRWKRVHRSPGPRGEGARAVSSICRRHPSWSRRPRRFSAVARFWWSAERVRHRGSGWSRRPGTHPVEREDDHVLPQRHVPASTRQRLPAHLGRESPAPCTSTPTRTESQGRSRFCSRLVINGSGSCSGIARIARIHALAAPPPSLYAARSRSSLAAVRAPSSSRRPASRTPGTTHPACDPTTQRCADVVDSGPCSSDLSIDVRNCGACGNVCPPDDACVAGVCTGCGDTCADGDSCCATISSAASGASCVDTMTDVRNCGAGGDLCLGPRHVHRAGERVPVPCPPARVR